MIDESVDVVCPGVTIRDPSNAPRRFSGPTDWYSIHPVESGADDPSRSKYTFFNVPLMLIWYVPLVVPYAALISATVLRGTMYWRRNDRRASWYSSSMASTSKLYSVLSKTDAIFPVKFPVTGSRVVSVGRVVTLLYVTFESELAWSWIVNACPYSTFPSEVDVIDVTTSEYVNADGSVAVFVSGRTTVTLYVPLLFAGTWALNWEPLTYDVATAFVSPILTMEDGENPLPLRRIYPPERATAVSSSGTHSLSVTSTLLMINGAPTPDPLTPFVTTTFDEILTTPSTVDKDAVPSKIVETYKSRNRLDVDPRSYVAFAVGTMSPHANDPSIANDPETSRFDTVYDPPNRPSETVPDTIDDAFAFPTNDAATTLSLTDHDPNETFPTESNVSTKTPPSSFPIGVYTAFACRSAYPNNGFPSEEILFPTGITFPVCVMAPLMIRVATVPPTVTSTPPGVVPSTSPSPVVSSGRKRKLTGSLLRVTPSSASIVPVKISSWDQTSPTHAPSTDPVILDAKTFDHGCDSFPIVAALVDNNAVVMVFPPKSPTTSDDASIVSHGRSFVPIH